MVYLIMSEFFLIGLLCLVNPFTGVSECAYINENPIVYYTEVECSKKKVKKASEIALNLTSRGFNISYLDVQCIVDKGNKTLDFSPQS